MRGRFVGPPDKGLAEASGSGSAGEERETPEGHRAVSQTALLSGPRGLPGGAGRTGMLPSSTSLPCAPQSTGSTLNENWGLASFTCETQAVQTRWVRQIV